MDSLLSKIGPLKALVPVKKDLHAEGSEASQMQPVSVKVCTCRSASALTKSSSTIASNTPSVQDISTDSAFSPLPLNLSWAAVPSPLKFLWFNKRSNHISDEEERSEHVQSSEIESKKVPEIPPIVGEDDNRTEPLVISSQINSQSKSSLVDAEKKIIQQSTCNDGALNEGSNATMTPDREHLVDAVTRGSMADATNGDHISRKSWISRITDFKSLWPLRKVSSVSTSNPKMNVCSTKEETASRGASDPTCFSDGCDLSDCYGCSLEVPYTKVPHNKETFSKYLQDASLFDMKVLAELSFLCDMAYMIPEIQPGQLLRHHHLTFITSSFEKKAEADANIKEAKLQKKDPINIKVASSSSKITSSEGMTTDLGHAMCSSEQNYVLPPENDPSEKAHVVNQPELQNTEWKLNASNDQDGFDSEGEDALLAVAPGAAVVLAEEETKLAMGSDPQVPGSCPCEWFVCDDESSHTRFFVIQGSDSVASWQTNLFFEPARFEGLDVLVHRGVYDAANALYEQILPMVLAHFEAHGDVARIRLTGHSLGGSLATLLALMFQIRGVLPKECILPIVTFGAPCIMCGGDKLLQKMSLPANYIQSIIMHRDIVPRAFSCDYPDHLAEILKRLNGKFRDHPCLNNQKLIYAPMGQLLILQPDETTAPSHPLLPCGHGLYFLRHPTNGGGVERAMELRAAQRAFLNMPHPLEILSSPGAYGLNGMVSRDHNPSSYMKAVHLVLRHEVKRLRGVQREQRRQFWWPLVIAETPWFASKERTSSYIIDREKVNGMLTPVACKSSLFAGQPIIGGKFSVFGRINFPQKGPSLWEFQKTAVSRYARLIASKHVQLGMLFIVSIRVIIVECLQTIYVWI